MASPRVPAVLVAALALAGCQTVVVGSHRDPSAGSLAFERPLAIVDYPAEEDTERFRRAGEMELVNSLPELNLVPSYRTFALEELRDVDAAKRRASIEGYDGILLLRVTQARVQKGYDTLEVGGDGFVAANGPDWLDVRVTATVVSLAEDREVWSAIVDRLDDKGRKKDVTAIARAVAKQMRADGLLAAPQR